MKGLMTLVLFLSLSANAVGARAQDSWGVDFVGYLPGTIEDIHVQGDFAYCATQCGLLVLDVSSVTAPVQVAFLPVYHENHIMLSLYQGVTVDGDFAYLVGPWGPMQIIDISNPAAPVLAGFCDAPEYASDVVAAGDYAYVTDEYAGLRIIDISDPTAAHQVGFVPLPSRPRGLALDGTTVYVAAYQAGLRVIDVGDPTAPMEIGGCDVIGNNRGVAVADGFAYVTGGGGISIVDVGVPSTPAVVGVYTASEYGSVLDVEVVGDLAYLSYGSAGLQVVDISDPVLPARVGMCDIYGTNKHLMVAGNHVYLASGYRGLHIINIDKPDAPTKVAWYFTLGIANDVQVQGDHAYVAGGYTCDAKDGATREGTSGFFVVNVGDPALPFLSGSSPIFSPTTGVAVDGTRACAVTGYSGFHCYDVSDPASPDEVGYLALVGEAGNAEMVGDLVYLDHSGLRIMDIGNPAEPVELSVFHPHQITSDVKVVGSYAYLAEYLNGLVIVDVSDPAAPFEAGSVSVPSRAEGIAVEGSHAYVADWFEGLIVYDVSDPTAPVQVGVCPTPEYAFDVAVAGNFAFVADQFAGIRVIDVRVPSAPVEVGFFKVLLQLHSVTTHEDLIYATCGYGGLFILRFDEVAGIDENDPTPRTPRNFALLQNQPNPFNPSTVIRFELPEPTTVSLRVFDITGRLVRILRDNEAVSSGTHRAIWNGRDDSGRTVATGMYFYRLEAATFFETKRMTLVK